jgi:hypothetical protein
MTTHVPALDHKRITTWHTTGCICTPSTASNRFTPLCDYYLIASRKDSNRDAIR